MLAVSPAKPTRGRAVLVARQGQLHHALADAGHAHPGSSPPPVGAIRAGARPVEPACRPGGRVRQGPAMTRTAALLATAAVVVGLAVGTFAALRQAGAIPFADCRDGVVAGGAAAIGGPFALTDADGRRVTRRRGDHRADARLLRLRLLPRLLPDRPRPQRARRRPARRARGRGRAGLRLDRPGPRHPRGGRRLRRGDPPRPARADRHARGGRRGGQGLQGLLPQGRRRPRVLPDGPFDLHLPDGARCRLPRVLPLRRHPRGDRRLGRLLRRRAA